MGEENGTRIALFFFFALNVSRETTAHDLHNGMSDIIFAGQQVGCEAVQIAAYFYCVCDCVLFNMRTVLLGRVQGEEKKGLETEQWNLIFKDEN